MAGLSQKKAQKIIEHRTEHGLFVNRQQLLDVSSLGPKTFEQCSGFLRIMLTKDGCVFVKKCIQIKLLDVFFFLELLKPSRHQ